MVKHLRMALKCFEAGPKIFQRDEHIDHGDASDRNYPKMTIRSAIRKILSHLPFVFSYPTIIQKQQQRNGRVSLQGQDVYTVQAMQIAG